MHMRIYDEDVQKGEKQAAFCCDRVEPLERNRFHLEPLLSPFSWNQPLQQQQWRLLAAVSAHVAHNQVLHVHGGIQP